MHKANHELIFLHRDNYAGSLFYLKTENTYCMAYSMPSSKLSDAFGS